MDSFRGLRVHSNDKQISARFDDLTLADLTPGDVVIRARYSSINYKDVLAVTGKGRIMKSMPLVAGIDVAGVVHSSQSEQFKPGDEVLVTGCGLGETVDGGYATFVRAQPDWVVPVPAGLSMWDTMCIGTAGFTAALAVLRMENNGQTPAGGPIVVTGASGGVGSFAVSMLARLGYEVVAMSGKESAHDFLTGLGAARVIGRDAVPAAGKPLEKALWAGAIDNVGGETLAWLTRTVDWWGNIASIGLVGGHELHTTVMPFILRGINLLGVNSVRTPRAQRLEVWSALAGDGRPDLQAIGTRTEKLSDLPGLLDAYLAGNVTGRTVIEID